MMVALFWLAQTGDSATATDVDQALNNALLYDQQAYYQICGDRRKLARFHELQKRAQHLSERYNQLYHPDDIITRYVDRRVEGRCSDPHGFGRTSTAWSRSLDAIESRMEGNH